MSELSPDTKALLARARGSRPLDRGHRAKLKAAVIAHVAAAALATTSATAAASSGTAIAKILAALGIGAGIGVGALVVRHEVTKPAEQPAAVQPSRSVQAPLPVQAAVHEVATPSATSSAPLPPAPVSPEPAAVAPSTPAAAEPRVPAASVVLPVSASAAVLAPPVAPTSIGEEARLIRDADRAVKAGDAEAAMRYLQEHARRFPSGALAPERAVQRVLALCVAGRVQEAKAQAAPLLAAGGPLEARIRGSCAGR